MRVGDYCDSSLKSGVKNGIKIMQKKPLKEVPDRAYEHKPKYSLEVLKEFPGLMDWLKEISRHRKLEDFVFISDYKKGEIHLKIFTRNHCYPIVVKLPTDEKPSGYLGTYVNNRKPRAGENWTRGNDLPDGSYSKETWNAFKNSLISYELVKVVRNSADKREK